MLFHKHLEICLYITVSGVYRQHAVLERREGPWRHQINPHHVLDSTTRADLGTVPASGYLLAVDARTEPVRVAGSAGRLSMRDARRRGLLRTVAVGQSAGARGIAEVLGTRGELSQLCNSPEALLYA
jgi:hypothetical protein